MLPQAYRYSDYIDFVSFRAPYGAASRLFFKGKDPYIAYYAGVPCDGPNEVSSRQPNPLFGINRQTPT